MRKKLNLGFLNYTDKAVPSEQFGLPSIECNTNVLPDFLALYGEKSNYHKTPFTATSFYQYDDVWDGKDGYIEDVGSNRVGYLGWNPGSSEEPTELTFWQKIVQFFVSIGEFFVKLFTWSW